MFTISNRVYFITSGYPFLVSKLCKVIDEKIMVENELKWEKEYIDIAVKELIKETNTNFDSLIKNIENDVELYNFIRKLVLEDTEITYIKTDEIIYKGSIYGILKEENGLCKMNNRIYEQIIYNHMMVKVIRKGNYNVMSEYNYKSNFINDNGDLDLEKVLLKFQEFMKHEYSAKRETFLEEDGRLIFLAFISPIINGIGFAFKEVKGGEEKRFDIVITYNKKMYIIELKIWRGVEYHKKGLVQLGEYLEQYGLDKGYLLIFDFRKTESLSGEGKFSEIKCADKNKLIFEAYC